MFHGFFGVQGCIYIYHSFEPTFHSIKGFWEGPKKCFKGKVSSISNFYADATKPYTQGVVFRQFGDQNSLQRLKNSMLTLAVALNNLFPDSLRSSWSVFFLSKIKSQRNLRGWCILEEFLEIFPK